jgi:triacylglycerol esterase/lipase EstA (alpha/beta hydrolase family)
MNVTLISNKGENICYVPLQIKSLSLPVFDREISLSVPSQITNTSANGRIAATFTTGKAAITLGCDKVFDKPIIIIEGFDRTNTNTIMNYLVPYHETTFSTMLNNGYDLVYLDFNDATTWIQNNANVLIQLIQQVNLTKVGNNKCVVIGESMGGLVARYALRKMEIEGQTHNCSHYISFDTPHKGASVPVGLQTLLNDLSDSNLLYALASLFSSELVETINAANTPAAQQMLMRYKGPDPHINFINFQNELNQMGFPTQTTRNLAMLSGALDGTPQQTDDGITETPGLEILKKSGTYVLTNWDINATTNNLNTNTKVSELTVVNFILFPILVVKTKNFTIPLNYDILAGGNYRVERQASGLGSKFQYAFIPTFSGVCYQGSLNTQASLTIDASNALKSNGLSPFDKVYGNNINDEHVIARQKASSWQNLFNTEFVINNGICPVSNQAPSPYFNTTYYLPCGGYTFALLNTPIGAVNTVWNVQPGNLNFTGNSFTLYNYQVPNNIPYTVKCTVNFLGNNTTASYTCTIFGICRNGSAKVSTEKTVDSTEISLQNDLLVYPNPTSGSFTIDIDNGLFKANETLKVIIYRENGTVLLEQNAVNTENKIPINFDNVNDGNFTVVVYSADKKISKKITIRN